MQVGQKVHFQLQIAFPAGMIDLVIELFTPDNDTTVMLLCTPRVSYVGKFVNFTGPGIPVLDSLDGTYNVSLCFIPQINV